MIHHADCIDLLPTLEAESVDLVCADPPYGPGTPFSEAWRTDAGTAPAPTTEVLRSLLNGSMYMYLRWMEPRLIEMHRVLKPTGSIYLHCDPTANSYLRLLMDAVFGRANFRNEIVWCYTGPGNFKRDFARKHDTILRYAVGKRWTFNSDDVRVAYSSLGAQRAVGGSYGNFDRLTKETVDEYLERGKVPEDYWVEKRDGMTPVSRLHRERTGWPTQKPLALYERIIRASSNPGDTVLDPFCGSGTTLLAALKLDRRHIGIDIDENAVRTARMRLYRTNTPSQRGRRPDSRVLDAGSPGQGRGRIHPSWKREYVGEPSAQAPPGNPHSTTIPKEK